MSSPTTTERPTSAARNNAEWCDVVCRSHHAPTRFADDAWTSTARTPQYYPDAVTLVPDVSVPELLNRIDSSPGCSVKDSFASLDLRGFGFRVLFDAQWIARPSAPMSPRPDGLRWEVVRDRRDLARWEHACLGEDSGAGILRPEILDHDAVAVLAAYAVDRVVAGAILNRSAAVVGISNVFARGCTPATGWAGCAAFATALYPESTLVGYESGDQLASAAGVGFGLAGPLRVWIREG